MKRVMVAAIAVAVSLGAAANASAATILFQNLVAQFSNVQGGVNVIVNNNPGGSPNAFISWGGDGVNPMTGSGYIMDVVDTPPGVVVAVPPVPSAAFTLGTFTHANFPIPLDTGITGLVLTISADVSVDGTPIGNYDFSYQVNHFETLNGPNPCADGGANGVGVNVNGCADRVSMGFLGISDSFSFGGNQYSLEVLGFFRNGQFATEFWTAESSPNNAQLIGRVNFRSEIPEVVPEPGTIGLMLTGLALGAAAVRRRRGRVS